MASIRIYGIDKLQRKLGNAAANRTLRPPMNDAVNEIQRRMQVYPVRPASSYVRTGTLGRRWTNKITTNRSGVRGVVGNNTEYAPWVQSGDFQAWMHRGYWKNTDTKVMEMLRPYIMDKFQEAIDKALEGK